MKIQKKFWGVGLGGGGGHGRCEQRSEVFVKFQENIYIFFFFFFFFLGGGGLVRGVRVDVNGEVQFL